MGGIASLLVVVGVLWRSLTGGTPPDKRPPDAPAVQIAATAPGKAAAAPLEPEVLKLEPTTPPNPAKSGPATAAKSARPPRLPPAEPVAQPKPAAAAKVAAAAKTKPAGAAPAKPQPARPKEPPKLPPPAPEEVEKALALVREIHKDGFAQANTPAENQVLARKLLEEAQRTDGDPVGRYALLYAVHRAGMLSGEVPATFDPIEEMARFYAITALDMKALAIVEMLKNVRAPAQQKGLVSQALGLMERAGEQGKYNLVQKLAGQVAVTAHRNRDTELTKSLTAVNKRIPGADVDGGEISGSAGDAQDGPRRYGRPPGHGPLFVLHHGRLGPWPAAPGPGGRRRLQPVGRAGVPAAVQERRAAQGG